MVEHGLNVLENLKKESNRLEKAIKEYSRVISERSLTEINQFRPQTTEFEIEFKNQLYETEDSIREKYLSASEIKLDEIDLDEYKGISIESKNRYLKLQLEMYKFHIKILEHTQRINKISNTVTNGSITIQDIIIGNQLRKLEKYTIGTKKKSEASQQRWALAQCYFAEEIPKHRTLKKAREVAARKAGIVVEPRQLIKMLPTPK